jgi:hypothetical protein
MRYVWIVSRGERGEDSEIVAVRLRRPGAVKVALSQPRHFNGAWLPYARDSQGRTCSWANGCDYVAIQRFKVE